jgi:hypothetical protein
MMVTLLAQDPCAVCGWHRTGVMVCTVRVNKRSMRTYGTNLIMLPERCQECGATSKWPGVIDSWRLVPDDAEKVQAYRLRRWPELAAELVGSGGAS